LEILLMKTLSRLAHITHPIILGFNFVTSLTSAAFMLALAGGLAYILMDAGFFLIFPVLIATKGVLVILGAFEPFVSKQKPSPAPATFQPQPKSAHAPQRQTAPESRRRRPR
jgi:hypothetical protein